MPLSSDRLRNYNRVLQIKPSFTRVYYNRGMAYEKVGDIQDALSDYDKGISIDPDGALDPLFRRANIYDDQGKTKQAIVDLERATKLKPTTSSSDDLAEAFYNLGIFYRKIGDLKGAISAYTQALHYSPSDYEIYNNRGIAYGENSQLDFAIDDFTRAI